jgi:plasmid replication initiation protein
MGPYAVGAIVVLGRVVGFESMETAAVQLDMFTVTACDPPLRDNRDVMEYPFLSLQKKRVKPIEYKAENISIEVHAPVKFGIATIWDWDVVIFAASHLNDAIEQGRAVSPRIRFVPYDALRQMGRGTSGRHYRELAQAIRRLRVTTIITNIRYDDEAGEERPFSWLSSYSLPKRYTAGRITPDAPDGEADPSQPWEIELPPWLFNAILRRREILAVHPAYFELTGGIERWLYRLARKAVPDRADFPGISFRVETLFARSGLSGRLRKFRGKLDDIEARQPLPEYDLIVNRDGPHELVTLLRNRSKPGRLPRGVKGLALPEVKKPQGPPRETVQAWERARSALLAMKRKRLSNEEIIRMLPRLQILRIEGRTAILRAAEGCGDEIRDVLAVDLATAFKLSSREFINGVIIEDAPAA